MPDPFRREYLNTPEPWEVKIEAALASAIGRYRFTPELERDLLHSVMAAIGPVMHLWRLDPARYSQDDLRRALADDGLTLLVRHDPAFAALTHIALMALRELDRSDRARRPSLDQIDEAARAAVREHAAAMEQALLDKMRSPDA